MKTWLSWFAINGLFMAFFVFGHMLPPFVFGGIYFLIWSMTVFLLIIFMLGCFTVMYSDNIEVMQHQAEKVKALKSENDKLFRTVDLVYDAVMIALLWGLGFNVYVFFYMAVLLLFEFYKALLKDLSDD